MKDELIATLKRAQARHLKWMQRVADMIAHPEKYPTRNMQNDLDMMNYHAHLCKSLIKKIAACEC